jgi:hypothetical protein
LILWLAVIEGGQGALVGLQPIEKDSYADTHSVALKCTSLAHKGDNMQRYIVGRQLLVVLIVFVTNMMGSAVADAAVLGLSDTFNEIFLATGIAMILTTIILGQLTAQVNAANCMLDFINNYFMLFSTHLSLFIEFSGLLHSVYLVQIVFSKLTGQQIHSNEVGYPSLNCYSFPLHVLECFPNAKHSCTKSFDSFYSHPELYFRISFSGLELFSLSAFCHLPLQ